MAKFRLSRRAEADLLEIAEYTLRAWGDKQTDRYLTTLQSFCQTLADNPALGRACEEIRPALRRMEKGRHVIFYRQEKRGILILRILHQRMLPWRHHLDND